MPCRFLFTTICHLIVFFDLVPAVPQASLFSAISMKVSVTWCSGSCRTARGTCLSALCAHSFLFLKLS